MEINEIVNLINSIGFPALVCILLLKNNQNQSEVIRENTRVIQALADRIDGILHKGGE